MYVAQFKINSSHFALSLDYQNYQNKDKTLIISFNQKTLLINCNLVRIFQKYIDTTIKPNESNENWNKLNRNNNSLCQCKLSLSYSINTLTHVQGNKIN